MNMWAAIVLIVAIATIGRVLSGGRWNRQMRRWERRPHDEAAHAASAEVGQLRAEVVRLSERVRTLEKIATDPSHQLADEIERLRSLPTARTETPDRPTA